MDADCLIKLTKAGLKETVCQSDTVFIPAIVVREVVDAGKIKGCSDAFAVEKNISLNLISKYQTKALFTKPVIVLLTIYLSPKNMTLLPRMMLN